MNAQYAICVVRGVCIRWIVAADAVDCTACTLQTDDVSAIAGQFGHEQQLEAHLVHALADFLQRERTKRL